MNPVDGYARDVVAGTIPAGKYHRLSCERHLSDRAREGTPGFPYVFVWAKAEKFLTFARLMKHYKGRQFAGQSFEPTPCQVFRLGSIFGWRQQQTGFRRFTTSYNELPRKQGKTFELAVVSVYVTFFEGEAGAEGYNIATKEKQARIAFDAAKKLVQSSGLASRITINAANLHRVSTESKLEPVGSDSDTTDGLNPHFVGVDELHAFKTRGLLDVMESATGARVNPLIFQITTAGDDPVSVGGDQHDYACRILDGVLEDDESTVAFFVFIAHADVDDDPFEEATWRKANPHWGISVNPEDMRKLAAKAKRMPSAAPEFFQKRLNLWVNASTPWLSLDGWRQGQTDWQPDELLKRPCWGGVDLSSKIDLTAFVLVFPPTPTRPQWRQLLWAFTPEETLDERALKDKAPYREWVNAGWLTLCKATKRINYTQVLEVIEAQKKRFAIQAIGFDPHNAENLQHDLVDKAKFGEEQVIEVPQNLAGLSQACKDYEADVLGGMVDARNDPLQAWCVSNAVVKRDDRDNIMPTKKRSRGRIDPVSAAVIARATHRLVPEQKPRGPLVPKVWTPGGFVPAIQEGSATGAHRPTV